ncbi:MAG: tRNA uridine-5-carboxymethylaminomethyl(34) synthesis GTPase MnmE [Alphaproteobacteria bacterium]|nr:tRNA uridine-5-carboxymethylaminomethyl(34) synthesis GTPase MnmE [Alphaproteobacteria bacterium]
MPADTIAALATGAGRAGVAIVRVSGPHAGACLDALTQKPRPKPHRATVRTFMHPHTREQIDEGLALFMPSPNSFTGEDVAEFQVHGGGAIVAALIDALTALPNVRLAEPGEFTRRAFEHGKLDLTQAEAIADLVDAETEGQRKQALRQFRGALENRIEQWRSALIRIMALCEAEIDFPDEDLPDQLAQTARPLIASLSVELASFLDDAHRGERVRDGFRIAIIGAPNAGKSSLLNALAKREAAIVSDIPGTTRDIVEVRMVLAGYPVWIADTAGLREASDAIEAEGVRRALERARDADLRIGVIDSRETAIPDALAAHDIAVFSKVDLAAPHADAMREARTRDLEPRPLSVRTGEGVAALVVAVEQRVAAALASEEAAPITRARHRALIEETHAALTRADAALEEGAELAAEDLRLAARALGRITGRVDVEDILGEIFSRFCIGK